MSPAVMSGLPAELLFLICDAADRSDLYSIALTSRILNEAATPALYSVIDLQLFHAIYACARALASPASKTSLNRDLAGFVESISLRHPNRSATTWTLKDKELGVIKRRLAHAIPRMWRLQSFTCRIAGLYHMGETFTTLASGSLPLVHTIDIDVQLPFSDDVMVTPFAVTTRGLKTLKLRNGTNFFSAAYSAFLCSLLEASRHTLQSLSLSHKADVALQSAFRSSFPVLWELDVPIGILSEPAFLDTSGIRHLVISKFWEALEIDPALLPNLEEVTCFSHQLATFLPEQAQHRRPIRTITLDRAEYGLPRLHFLSGDLGMQVWRVANDPAMRSLQFSAAPLVRLSFLVSELSVPYLEDLLPIFQELQYLYISLQVKRGERGQRVQDRYSNHEVAALASLLKGMPRLHTFLLSCGWTDGVGRTYDGRPSDFAHNEDLQRGVLSVYDRHSSTLKRAAFTSEFEWERSEDGWHPRGHALVAEQEVVSDGEDEEEGREPRLVKL